MNSNKKQQTNGKAFEYALLKEFEEKLKNKTNVEVIQNSSLTIAQNCFNSVTANEQSEFLLSASFAVNFLVDIEPRLSNHFDTDDILQLEILSDDKGKNGDVRDVIAIRLVQKWEIGISAKNNHDAVKHSRLSTQLDFGHKWLGINCSTKYFEDIKPIFEELEKIRKESERKKLWKDLGKFKDNVYTTVLEAFKNELLRLYKTSPKSVSQNLVTYLIGNKDFYKVIKKKNKIEIYAYNLYGNLNLAFQKIEPKYKTPVIALPTEIKDISFKENSNTTVIVTMNNDWILSFRIHNASSRVEASLKFDVKLEKSPKTLFKNTLNIKS
jgi:hypothetical protein